MMEDYLFGECPICRQGQLIAVKDTLTEQLLVMCDDCESQWRSPEEAQSYKNALPNEIRNIKEASLEEIKAIGWLP